MVINKKIAVLCNYELLPDRIGGMDYFFWLFDAKCKANNIEADWFFPNKSSHGDYPKLHIISSDYEEVETYFSRHYNDQDYSHIITHFIELCTPFFKSIKKKGQARIIAIDHNPRPINGYPFKKRLEKRIKGILFSKYIDAFVAVSDYSKTQLIKEFGPQLKQKTKVVFNGIDAGKYTRKSDFTFNGKFLVACHLRKDKGLQDLVLAINALQKPIPFCVDIYGKGDYQPTLEAMIAEFSLADVFHFKGSVANLNELYHQYDYLVHPSQGETFCYSVVESLMARLPVITTRNQGNVLGLVSENRNGFLFEERNWSQLAAILQHIAYDKAGIPHFFDNPELSKLTLDHMVSNHFTLL